MLSAQESEDIGRICPHEGGGDGFPTGGAAEGFITLGTN